MMLMSVLLEELEACTEFIQCGNIKTLKNSL